MNTMIRSVIQSLLIAVAAAALILVVTIRMIAPGLPRVVGAPALDETYRFRWEDTTHLDLRNNDGLVRIIPGKTQTDIEATARIRVYLRDRDQEALAGEYAATMLQDSVEGTRVTLVGETKPRPDVLDIYIDYDIHVPEGVDLSVANDNGNIWITPGAGSIDLRGRNADMVVEGPHGKVAAQTLNGRIRADHVPAGATLDTVNGNIYARLTGGLVQATTTNGAIVLHMQGPEHKSCRLSSQNGGITVTTDGGAAMAVDAQTAYGDVRSDLAVNTAAGISERRRVIGRIPGRERNDRPDDVRIETLNGNIWITQGAGHATVEMPTDGNGAP